MGKGMWSLLAVFLAALGLLAGQALARGTETSFGRRFLVSLLGAGAALCARQAFRPAPARRSFGSAAFARPQEFADWCVPAGAPLPAGSVLLGRMGRQRIALPPPFTGQHGLLLGGSGTGKSFSFFLPNMAFGRGVSCVATDPKSELWQYTSGYHQATRFAPNDPDASAAFNWIPLCGDARLAALCARAIVEAGETERQEAPWPDLETAFLSALFAHASTLAVPTPLTAYRLLTRTPPGDLMAQFLASASAVAREQAVIFQQTHERMRGSITPVLAAKLQWLRVPAIERFTSSSFVAPDFGRLRAAPQALFWCVREQDIVLLRPLSALFFTLLLEQLAAVKPENCGAPGGSAVSGNYGVPVHLYLDEFANIGVIPHYETIISLARGRGLSLWHGLQSLSQLEACYGKANAQTILTNCATKIALHGLDVETAEYVSRSLGEGTAAVARRSFQTRRWALFSSSVSDSVQEHARRLLTADEVRRLGSGQALVITGNRRPIVLDKFVYDLAPKAAGAPCLGPARAMPLSLPPGSELPPHSELPPGRERAPRQRRTSDAAPADENLPPPFPEELQASVPAKHAGARFSRRRPSGHRQTTWVSRPPAQTK